MQKEYVLLFEIVRSNENTPNTTIYCSSPRAINFYDVLSSSLKSMIDSLTCTILIAYHLLYNNYCLLPTEYDATMLHCMKSQLLIAVFTATTSNHALYEDIRVSSYDSYHVSYLSHIHVFVPYDHDVLYACMFNIKYHLLVSLCHIFACDRID